MESIYKLEIIQLKNEIHFLSEEIKMLKHALQSQCLPSRFKRAHTMSDETKKKWQRYHENKERVKEEVGPNASWHSVKKITDELE